MTTKNNSTQTSNHFFHKSDFIKISVAVLITLLISYHFPLPLQSAQSGESDNRISTKQMIDFQDQYSESEKIQICYDLNGNSKMGELEGFPIATVDLEEIIHHNKIKGFLGFGKKPDRILFYLGRDGSSTKCGQKVGNLKLIAVGAKGKQLLIPEDPNDWSDRNKSSIYDKADPCPGPGCPPKSGLTPPGQ